jgi:hypothetical protein
MSLSRIGFAIAEVGIGGAGGGTAGAGGGAAGAVIVEIGAAAGMPSRSPPVFLMA